MAWLVVSFTNEGAVEVIPDNWYVPASSAECYWPPYDKNKIAKAIKSRQAPASTWSKVQIKMLGKYDDFQKAQIKCKKAEEQDNLTSQSESYTSLQVGKGCRKKKGNSRYMSSSNDEDSLSSNEDPNDPRIPLELSSRSKADVIDKRSSLMQTKKDVLSKSVPEKTHPKDSDPVLEDESVKDTSGVHDITEDLITFIEQTKEFQRQVLRQLFIMKARLAEHSENFQLLLANMKEKDVVEESTPATNENTENISKLLPIATLRELKKVEFYLQQQDTTADCWAKELSHLGGDTAKDITKRILHTLLSDTVASLYSWEGAKGKSIFKTLLLSSVILKAVRLNRNTSAATQADVIKAVKTWLVRAPGRLKAANKNRTDRNISDDNNGGSDEDEAGPEI